MKLDHMVVRPLFVNCFFLSDDDGNLIVFDPGGDADLIIDKIESENLKPKMILNTHGHFDHIGAVSELKEKYGIPFYIHKDDEFLLGQSKSHASLFGAEPAPVPAADGYVKDGDEIEFGGGKIKVLHTPGHTPGGVCYFIEPINAVITGDTLFCEGIGRSDFPYANHLELINGIAEKLLTLDDAVTVHPGHEEFSTIGWEKKNNPYLRKI